MASSSLIDLTKFDINGNPLYQHPQGSPYHGLTLKEQKYLSKLRRGPGRVPNAIRKRWKKANKHTYAAIFKHCLAALLHAAESDDVRLDRVRVVLRIPFNFRFHFKKDFPRGVIVGYDDWNTYMQYLVDSLIDYLYKIGESVFDAKTLRKELWGLLRDQERLVWLDTYTIDLCTLEYLNDAVPEYVATPKALKGRRHYRKKKKEETPVDSNPQV